VARRAQAEGLEQPWFETAKGSHHWLMGTADRQTLRLVFSVCSLSGGARNRLNLRGPLADARDPTRVLYSYAAMARARMALIAAGYEDCDDIDTLKADPALKIACGRCRTGADLMSQPTLSRLENRPDWRALARIELSLIDLYLPQLQDAAQAHRARHRRHRRSRARPAGWRSSRRITIAHASSRSISSMASRASRSCRCCGPAQRRYKHRRSPC
jgi:Transposase DDE domain group 1